MQRLLLATAFASASAYAVPHPNDDICDDIAGLIPDGCAMTTCDFSAGPALVECDLDLYIDTVKITVTLDLCNSPGGITFDASDTDLGVDFSHKFALDDTETIPIPGLGINVGIASAAVDVEADIDVDASEIDLDLGINACASIAIIGQECGSDLPVIGSYFPIELISGEWDFDDACSGSPGYAKLKAELLAKEAAKALPAP